MTTMAIASSSRKSWGSTVASFWRATLTMPASAAQTAQMTKAIILVRATLMPVAAAASRLPPTAKKWLPSRWRVSSRWAKTAKARNHRNCTGMMPILPAKVAMKESEPAKKLSGFMSVMTREPERIMNSVPSVVMNEGMPKPRVIAPLASPTSTAVPSAAQMAIASGTPAPQVSTNM